jgi:UDP-N-acetylglucosamine--N-acetylmuramyl-(pentapeptide) pyrophosphoryl-undecaprenol N-acetylglucosamine transferase
MKTIILTGGGTIGHCAPHFAVLPHILNYFDNVYYIGSKNGIEKDFVEKHGVKYYSICTVKLHRRLTLKNLAIPFGFIKSQIEAEKILKTLNPQVVFSKGGYVGLPVTLSAQKLKIPTVLHESDYSLGLANKIASKKANYVLTSFKNTALNLKNGVYVGAPIREEILVKNPLAVKRYNFNNLKPVLLVLGGSSGAKFINELVVNSLDELLKRFNVLHVVGKGNLTNVNRQDYYQSEFEDMQNAYSVCDIALSRAGSNTAFELMAIKVPSLFIPLPKTSSRGDQIQNANYFKNLNTCAVLHQENATKTVFLNLLFSLYDNRNFYKRNINDLNVLGANKKIAEILCKY